MSIYKVLSRSSGTLCRSFTLLSLSWNSQPFSTSLSSHFHSLLHQSPNKVIPIQASLLSALNSSLTWRFGLSSSASPQSASLNKRKLRIKPMNQHMKKAITDNPKKLANLIDLVNLPSTLRDFVGQSQISRLGCFISIWSYIKTNNLQDLNNKNVVNCDEKLKSILLGKPQVELAELPALIKLHFPKEPK